MGGNATFIKGDGTLVPAEKIDLIKTTRKGFTDKFVKAFKKINSLYAKAYKEKLWVDESKLVTGELFNGSTSYIFDDSIPDDELIKYKKSSGDLDVIVPEESKDNLFKLLMKLEGKEIVKDITFVGVTNAKTFGDTLICILAATFGDYKVMAQVDFELLPVEKESGTPEEWARFSHSSSFDDAKIGVKGVGHKYLIQAIIGGASVREDIVIATPSSKPGKVKLKKMNGDLPRMLKFSVGKGVRVAYEPMHNEDGSPLIMDGKEVYREIPSKGADSVTMVREIYKLVFQRLETNKKDEKLFWSMKGVVDLMNKFLTQKEVDRTMTRLIDMLWGMGGSSRAGQQLEDRNPEWDFQVKNGIYSYVAKTLKLYKHTKAIDKQIDKYYKEKFVVKGAVKESVESFKHYLELTGYTK